MYRENYAAEDSLLGNRRRSVRNRGKPTRYNSRAFLDRNNLVNRHIRQTVNLPAGPGNLQGLDLGALAEAKENARIAGRHVAHATFGLFYVHESFRGEFQRRADPISIGLRTDQRYFQPVLRIPAVVAKKFRIIAAVINRNIDIPIVVVVGGGYAAARDGANEIWPQRLRHLFKLPFAEVPEHQQRFFVRHFAVVKGNVIQHGAVELQNVVPTVVVVVQELHGNAAQQDRLVPDSRPECIVIERAILIVVIEPVQFEIEV